MPIAEHLHDPIQVFNNLEHSSLDLKEKARQHRLALHKKVAKLRYENQCRLAKAIYRLDLSAFIRGLECPFQPD